MSSPHQGRKGKGGVGRAGHRPDADAASRTPLSPRAPSTTRREAPATAGSGSSASATPELMILEGQPFPGDEAGGLASSPLLAMRNVGNSRGSHANVPQDLQPSSNAQPRTMAAAFGAHRGAVTGTTLDATAASAGKPLASSPHARPLLNRQLPGGRGNALDAGDPSVTLEDPTRYVRGGGHVKLSTPLESGSPLDPGHSLDPAHPVDGLDACERSKDPFATFSHMTGNDGRTTQAVFGGRDHRLHSVGGDDDARRESGLPGRVSVSRNVLDVSDSAVMAKGIAMGVARSPRACDGRRGSARSGRVNRPVSTSADATVPSSSSPILCSCLRGGGAGHCLPRDPRTIFCVGMLLLVLCSLIAPVICVVSLYSSFHYTEEALPQAVHTYIEWLDIVDSMEDVNNSILLYSYLGDRLAPWLIIPEVSMPMFDAAWHKAMDDPVSVYDRSRAKFLMQFLVDNTTARLENIARRLKARENDDDDEKRAQLKQIATLTTKLQDFKKGVLLDHINAATQHQKMMSKWNAGQWLRDEIGNNYYTTAAATTSARTASLLQLARLSCYRLPVCWEDTAPGGGREALDRIELLTGLATGTANNVLNQIFTEIGDPKGNATTLRELVYTYLGHTRARAALLEKAAGWFTELQVALAPYRASGTTTTGDSDGEETPAATPQPSKNLFFVLRRSWADELFDTVNLTLGMVKDVNNLYASNSPLAEWLQTSATDVLGTNPADHELLFPASFYNSIFSRKIGESLTLNFTAAEAAMYKKEYYERAIRSFLREVYSMMKEGEKDALKDLEKMVALSISMTIDKVDTLTLVPLILGLTVPLIPVMLLACCLRVRIRRSALSFPRLLLVLLVCYVIAAGAAVAHYMQATDVPRRSRAFTEELLQAAVMTMQDLRYASSAMDNGLHLALMIAGSLTEASDQLAFYVTFLEEMQKKYHDTVLPRVSTSSHRRMAAQWLTPMKTFLDLLQAMLEGGFDPIRHQYTHVTAAKLTRRALHDAYHMTDVSERLWPDPKDGAVGAAPVQMKSCWATMSDAAYNVLSANLISIVAVDEALFTNAVSLTEFDRSSSFTLASMESMCFAARLAAATEPATQGDCYILAVCDVPSSMGLLRSVGSGQSILNIFNPQDSDAIGPLLRTWREAIVMDIPADMTLQVGAMEVAAAHDALVVVAGRRFLVWFGVIVCLVLQGVGLATYAALFGENFFSNFLS